MSDLSQSSSASKQDSPAPATRWARLLAQFDPTALRISFGFFLFSSLWILFSDKLLVMLVKDPDTIGELAALKGVAYVSISALLLYGILNRYFIVLKQENLDRRKTEEQLRTSQTLQKAILDGTSNAVFAKDLEGRFLLFNLGAERYTGRKAADVIGRDTRALFPEPNATEVMAVDQAVIASGQSKSYEETLRNGAGEIRTYLTTKGPLRDELGRVTGLFGVSHDITERKSTEKITQESEQLYRALFEHMHEGFAYCRMVYDERQQPIDFVYVSVNRSFGRLTGLENVEGRSVTELIPGIREMSPEIFAIYGRVAATGNSETFEIEFKPLKRWLNVSAYCPAPGFFAAVFDDITERKLAADELRQSREEFRDLFDHAPVGYHEIDTQGRLVRVNEALLTMLGYTAAELLGQYVWKISAEEEVSRQAALAKLSGQASRLSFQRWFRRKDGRAFPVLIDDRVVKDGAGRITGLRAIIQDHTERHQAEVALERERKLLRTLIDTIPDPIYIKDCTGRFLLANQADASYLGVASPADLVGRSDLDFFSAAEAAQFRSDEDRVLRGQPLISQEESIALAGGGCRYVLTTKIALHDESGQVTGLVGIGRDITAQKLAEGALSKSEQHLQLATQVGRIGTFEHDYVTKKFHASALLRELVALEAGEDEWMASLIEHIHSDDRAGFLAVVARSHDPATDGKAEHVHRFRRPDGTYVWLQMRSQTWFEGEGAARRPIRTIGTVMDITASRLADERLERERTLLRTLIDTIPDPIYVKGADSGFLLANQAVAKFIGAATPAELIGRSDRDYFSSDQAAGFRADEERVLLGCPVISQEETLRESEMRFREMAENIGEVFWMVNPGSTQILYISPAYAKIWGRSCQSIYADPASWAAAIQAEDRPRVLEAYERFQTSGEYNESYRIVRPDGTSRWIRDRGFPVRDESGTVRRLVGIAEDITETHKLEEQFRQAQKLEAIGTLAGGIAHDFNNILAAIIGFTELARMRVKDNPVVSEYLASVMQGSERAVALVRQILAFSRGQEQAKRPLQLKQIVAESLRLMRATIPSNIAFAIDLPGNLGTVLADPTQVQQVVMNLCTNAWHAMKNRPGQLGIKLENITVDGLTAAGHAALRPGPYVRLTISDTGHGMKEETKKRIFEPFFTTKGPGEGTGLGLSVVHGIMQSYGGVITVYTQPEVGTTFHLYFPAQQAAAAEPETPAASSPTGHGERILFVDDEQPIALMSQQVLTGLGYRVESRTSAVAALEAVRANPAAYDLVITDLTMPEMTGVDLARQLLALRPDLRIILSTGFSATLTPERARAMGIRDLLLKPHTVQSLALAVQRALSETNP